MKIIVAPDSFKGSMASNEVIDITKSTFEEHFPSISVIGIPIADGGEGTIDAIISVMDGVKVNRNVRGPLGHLKESYFGVVGDTAIVEMANCSGITLIKDNERNPMETSTYGTGEMIKFALEAGYKKILIGIGGSATNDGGTGALEALGVEFRNDRNQLIRDLSGGKLGQINTINSEALHHIMDGVEIKVMCDVDNPLTGSRGATTVYGKQKGGSDEQLRHLEKGMLSYQEVVKNHFGIDYGEIPGTGAAGGLGLALKAFLNADLVSGIDELLDMNNFDSNLKDVDFIITGEGRLDSQSVQGKVVDGITKRTKDKNIPVVVIAGGVEAGFEVVYDQGVDVVLTLPNKPMSLVDAMNNSKKLLKETLDDFCRSLKLGKKL